jgi:hypothetical protein
MLTLPWPGESAAFSESGFGADRAGEVGAVKFHASDRSYAPSEIEVCPCSRASGQGEPMDRFFEDYQKQRLTERFDMLTAINILKSQGYEEEDLIREIIRVFYVDLDTYNEVVSQAA